MLNDQQQLIDMLTDVAERGGPVYRRRAAALRTVGAEAIADRLDGEGFRLFNVWEDESTAAADLFAAGRFRDGFADGLGDAAPSGDRRPAVVRTVTAGQVASRLDAEGRRLFARWEDENARDAGLLAEDQYGFGFAVGASGLVGRLVRDGLADAP